MRFIVVLIVLVSCFLSVTDSLASSHGSSLEPVAEGAEAEKLFLDQDLWGRRHDVLRAVDHSLRFLQSDKADQAYEHLESRGISRKIVSHSLRRFRFHLRTSRSAIELAKKLSQEFALYRSVGRDGQGTVRFTGYFQPTYKASRKRTAQYRFPIYSKPSDFKNWKGQHPSRMSLEGYDGQGRGKALLAGHELAFLKNRYEAFMIHVQGSAILDLIDGSKMAVGYAANTNYRFVGFTKSCLQNKKKTLSVKDFFLYHPDELNKCLAKNNRFIFFQEREFPDPIGSLGVPVIPLCSIATDKTHMPPGAFGLIKVQIPFKTENGSIALKDTSRIVLDQDSGGGIKGPGRVDIFMGTGPEAGRLANFVYSNGELYYFFLKHDVKSVQMKAASMSIKES